MIKQLLNNLFSKLSQKTAFGLILAVFILAAFSILGLTAVSLLTQQTTSYVDSLNNVKTYYLALAARNFAYEYYLPFRYNFDDLDITSSDITKTLGAGTFTVDITAIPTSRSISINFSGTIFAATPDETTTTLAQDFAMDPGVFTGVQPSKLFTDFQNYVAYIASSGNPSLGGGWHLPNCVASRFFGDVAVSGITVTLKKNCGVCGDQVQIGDSSISANIYISGDLSVETPSGDPLAVYGHAYAGGTITVTNPTELPVANRHEDQTFTSWPSLPNIATTYFDDLIELAGTISPGPRTLGTTSLNGENILVNGDVTITADSIITGPGSIIAKGAIIIGIRAQVGEMVNLIAENYIDIYGRDLPGPSYTILGGTWDGNVIEGKGILIYTPNNFFFESGDTVAYNVVIKGTLLFSGNQTTGRHQANTSIFGIIYRTGLDFYGINKTYGNVFRKAVTECLSLEDVYRYQDIPYTGGPREEIPLDIKGLYSLPRSALRFTP